MSYTANVTTGTGTATVTVSTGGRGPAGATGPAGAAGTSLTAGTGITLTEGVVSSTVTGNATHTGDATGSTALTLATVNSNIGSFTNASITVNAKGLVTAASNGTSAITTITGTANQITVSGAFASKTLSLPATINVDTTGNAATVTTHANLTGPVTSTGNATALGSFTLAQLDTATSDATLARTDAGQTFSGAQIFDSTTRPTSSGTGTPAATSLMTQKDIDDDRLDTTKIVFWDDFFGDTDAATIFGQMRWSRTDINGTGTFRPNQITGQFGAPALVTAATRRAGQLAFLDGSNLAGSPGFNLSQIQSTGTKIKFRFRITSLDCRVDIGFTVPSVAAVYTQSRFLGVSYTKKPAQWVGSTAYTTGDYVVPTVSNGRRYYASTGGTTSGSEPTWPTSATVPDGSVTWTEAGYEGSGNFVLMFRSSGADAASTIVSTGTAVAINTWYDVASEFTTGTNLAVSINGGTATNITTTSTSVSVTPVLHVETTTASAAELCVDYFGFVARVTR
jgi:hypothetical protein